MATKITATINENIIFNDLFIIYQYLVYVRIVYLVLLPKYTTTSSPFGVLHLYSSQL